jgi:hypothetical protein
MPEGVPLNRSPLFGLFAWPMNNETKKKAIKAGTIKGEITSDGAPAKFTDTTQNLARFVAAAGEDLFSNEPLRFERVH